MTAALLRLALPLACLLCAGAGPPAQVHLAYAVTHDGMRVAWSTPGSPLQPADTFVQWGTSPSQLDRRANGSATAFTQDAGRTWTQHVAEMTALPITEPTRIFYRVGGPGSGWTEPTSFVTNRGSAAQRVCWVGDMGTPFSHALCPACSNTTELCACGNSTLGLVSEAARGAAAIIHVGDLAYDLASNAGTRGDHFMQNMEQVAAQVPYHVAMGNHESFQNYAHYTERFRHMPANGTGAVITDNGQAPNNWFYSYDSGLVHYVAVSTELYFHPERLAHGAERQITWLRADLAAADDNRKAVPWIIVFGHRPLYNGNCPKGECSPNVGGPLVTGGCAQCCVDPGKCSACCPGNASTVPALEPLFHAFGVDIYVGGHVHDYERMYDVWRGQTSRRTVDMRATTYITTGDGGSDEGTGGAPFFPPRSSAFRSNAAGYSVMTVANGTHLRWQQVQTDPVQMPAYGKVIDDVWLVQHNHGPFAQRTAETVAETENKACLVHDVGSGRVWNTSLPPPVGLEPRPPVPGGGHDNW